jgi:hypothetical protein
MELNTLTAHNLRRIGRLERLLGVPDDVMEARVASLETQLGLPSPESSPERPSRG